MSMVSRRTAFGAALLTAFALSTIFVAPTAAATPRKVALGVAMHPDRSQAAYDRFVRQTGRAPAIWTMWIAWRGRGTAFPPMSFLNHLKANGTVPLIMWMPVDTRYPANAKKGITHKKIIQGKLDPYLNRFGNWVRRYNGPMILRFAHEMDGCWYPWSWCRFNNTPKSFINMWRHVYRVVNRRAPKVTFLWNPASPRPSINLRKLYPGDRYVDYVGMTAMNWGPKTRRRPGARWRTLPQLLANEIAVLRRITREPVIIPEVGSSPRAPRGTSKAEWIQTGYPALYKRWPFIKAIIYLNVNLKPAPDFHEDWRLITPRREPLQAYRRLLRQPRFQGRISAS
jgi:hypothetical protein